MKRSTILLVDGYNVVPPVAPPGRGSDVDWLQRERMQLIQRLAEHLEETVRRRTCVVFDASQPPRDRPDRFRVSEIEIRFAVEYAEADDLLEEIIFEHSAPKQLAVVSSDHRVQAAAKRRGAASFDSQPWFDQLLDGRVQLAPAIRAKSTRAGQGGVADVKPESGEEDVDRWMRDFGF